MKPTTTRSAGWLVTAALVGAAFGTPAMASANDGHQSAHRISWDVADFAGTPAECDGLDLALGEVFWHFVQTRVDSGIASGNLTATFDEAGVIGPVGVLHWGITTGEDTLVAFGSDVQGGGVLNLSHICAATEPAATEPAATEPAATPVGDVLAATGTPQLTPPPTDTLGDVVTTTGAGWHLVLLALAALLAGIQVVTPSTNRPCR